jgi:hypothetical protein
MRPFELLLTVQVAASFVARALSRRDRLVHLLPFAALALTVLQLLDEGYRWQMLPLYALAAGRKLPCHPASLDI